MEITSTAFVEGDTIPRPYTCDEEDLSPPLSFSGVPDTATTLALIVDDPDAPAGTWVHWVLFDLPAETSGLPEGVPKEPRPALGGSQGANSWGRTGYAGPCPPPPTGEHRYFFRLYALDAAIDLAPGARADDVRGAMDGHVLAEASLMGTYRR